MARSHHARPYHELPHSSGLLATGIVFSVVGGGMRQSCSNPNPISQSRLPAAMMGRKKSACNKRHSVPQKLETRRTQAQTQL
jgi:hypothetical protein